MKKVFCMVALAVICLGTVSASIPVKAASDTTKIKTKAVRKTYKRKVKGPHTKIKTKIKDTTRTQ
jgi:hypothetical protein